MIADMVLRGGRVFTAESTVGNPTAIAVAGDRIAHVGDDSEAIELIGPGTTVVELAGRLVTPGFIDAHVHPATSGLDLLRLRFDGCADSDDALTVLADYANGHPELEWIIGAGWAQPWFDRGCPSKEMLDSVIPDRPALIENADGHGGWVNSRALENAGITARTPDPPDGRIERNADGSPQGTLHEGAIDLVSSIGPQDTVDDFEAGLLQGQDHLLSFGITGWQDAIVRPVVHEAYLRLARSGRLLGRVVGAMWWERDRELDQIEELVERRRATGPNFSPTSVKLMLDGVVENFSAAMLTNYFSSDGSETTNSGTDFIDPDLLKRIVTLLDANGFQCHFHAIGDRAVRSALDAIDSARTENGPSDHRHHISHIQVVHPEDIGRFAKLDAIANAQPLWAQREVTQTELTMPFLGERRSSRQYPFGSLLAAGARLGMGSDWGVSTCNVMEEIAVAVTRKGARSDDEFYPSERLTPRQALTAFTAGSAFINHAESDSGTLAAGMIADLVVLDGDPLASGDFRSTHVDKTMVNGEFVYEVD
jgi:predicted amidohydrolase YtcJ